jgi:penicillin amidase
MGPRIGLEQFLQARSVKQMRNALSQVTIVMLNFIFADTDGNIGRQATGRLPIRTRGNGTLPVAVTDGADNWQGWIPFEDMPGDVNPAKGWLGACNHMTVDEKYPYYYSSYFSPSNRYLRLKELLASDDLTTADDHWQWQLDVLNPTARSIAPIMADALSRHAETKEAARYLAGWDFRDDPQQVAPTLFHGIYLEFTRRVLSDAAGDAAVEQLLADPYWWQERMEQIARSKRVSWFDGAGRQSQKSFDEVLHQAAVAALAALSSSLGPEVENWQWGRIHRIRFLNPIRRKGLGSGWLGGGDHPAPGSSATLNRGRYDFKAPYRVVVSPAMRVVFDLADPDKITAVLAGGVSGRTFSPHQTDQIDALLAGEKRYWWFSEDAVERNAVSVLELVPEQ